MEWLVLNKEKRFVDSSSGTETDVVDVDNISLL